MTRSDHRASRERLIAAAGRLFETQGRDVALADIAREAGLSVATVYRHFDGVDQVVDAYRRTVLDQLDGFVANCEDTGVPLFVSLCDFWVRLVLEHGAALAQHRSPEGFLERLHRVDGVLPGQVATVGRPLSELIEALGLEHVADIQITAAFLWNMMFDSREVLDLHRTLGFGPTQIANYLDHAFRGALLGWVSATSGSRESAPSQGSRDWPQPPTSRKAV